MSKKMAVRNKKSKQNKQSKTKKEIDISLPKFLKPGLKVILFVAVISGAAFSFSQLPNLWSGLWPIEKIAFTETLKYVDEKQLATLLKSEDMGGMLSIDLQDLREKVLLNPWVKDVGIRKKWPDTLIFHFQEYKPVALVNSEYLLENGHLMKYNDTEILSNIIRIQVEKNSSYQQQGLLELVVKLAKINQRLELHQFNVDQFLVNEGNNWSVEIKNKFLIKVGRKHQLERIERFLKVYAAIENKKSLQSIDLRYSNGFAVKIVQDSNGLKQNG